MVLPLIPIVIGTANVVRMVAPKVAEMLIKSGAAKKASKAAVNKVKGKPPSLNAKDAKKLAARSKPFVQSKSGAARPVPKSKLQSKMDKAKTGNDVATQGSRAVAKRPGSAVAKRPGSAVAKRPGSAVAKRPGSAVAKRPGSASSDKGKIVGLSNKSKIGLGAAAGAAAGYAGFGGEDKQSKADQPLPKRTVAKRKEPVPVDDTPRPKRKPPTPKKRPVQGPKDKPLKPLEGGVRYADNPFGKGKIKVDSSDAAFNMEPEFSGDYKGGKPGMKKNVARRRAGGKIGRGCGAAQRGGGKVMK